jgi:coatomer subunit gamma
VPSPFEGVVKNAVLHEANMFNDSNINAELCTNVLTKIMYLLVHGEKFSSDEATKLFFSVTKLFRSNDPLLRRMVYLVVKELGRDQENVFIVINCLSKDMTSNMDLFQANAIRVLCKIIDVRLN